MIHLLVDILFSIRKRKEIP